MAELSSCHEGSLESQRTNISENYSSRELMSGVLLQNDSSPAESRQHEIEDSNADIARKEQNDNDSSPSPEIWGIEYKTEADEAQADQQDDFVAIELTDTSTSQSTSEEDQQQDEFLSTMELPAPPSACGPNANHQQQDESLSTMKLPAPPSACEPNADPHTIYVSADSCQQPYNTQIQANPIQRRIFHHPILSPLAKLPWDRVVSAAGSCDLFFNCKYTMRQVEYEVRQEQDGIELGEEVAYGSQCSGREDRYVNVSLGHEHNYCSSEVQQQKEEPLPFFGLTGDEAAELEEENNTQQAATEPKQAVSDNSAGQTNDQIRNIVTDTKREEECWKRTNPSASASLDMLMYKTVIGE